MKVTSKENRKGEGENMLQSTDYRATVLVDVLCYCTCSGRFVKLALLGLAAVDGEGERVLNSISYSNKLTHLRGCVTTSNNKYAV